MNLKKVLIDLGLNEKEASVYLASLELGEAPASQVAMRAKLNRVSCYDILEKLKHKGFISVSEKKGVSTYIATDPDIIQGDFENKLKTLKSSLPELRQLHGKTSHAKIRYYEGLEAVKKVYADSLTAKTELLNYADSKSIREFWPDYDEEYVQERIRKGIYLRGIAPLDQTGKLVKAEPKAHREIRLVKRGPYSFKNEIMIYDDKVSIISFGNDDVIGMVLESPEIANTQRAIFMMAWEFAGGQN